MNGSTQGSATGLLVYCKCAVILALHFGDWRCDVNFAVAQAGYRRLLEEALGYLREPSEKSVEEVRQRELCLVPAGA